jgi:hypothetical protein
VDPHTILKFQKPLYFLMRVILDDEIADLFVDSAIEIGLEEKYRTHQIQVPNETAIANLADKFMSETINNDELVTCAMQGSSLGGIDEEVVKEIIKEEVDEIKELKNWKEQLKQIPNKLKSIATEIVGWAKRTGRKVSDILGKIRKRIFQWALTNSVVDSFEVKSIDETKVTFIPDSVKSTGTFSFGRLESDVETVDGVLAFLNLIPQISVTVEVNYVKKT